MPTSLHTWLKITCMHVRVSLSMCRLLTVTDRRMSAEVFRLWFKLKREIWVHKEETELEKRGSVPHGLVIRTLPCCCTGDRFFQCSGHIITFTHFCPVSRSTKASPSWDGQQKSCREVSPGSGLQQTFENALTKSVNKRLWGDKKGSVL